MTDGSAPRPDTWHLGRGKDIEFHPALDAAAIMDRVVGAAELGMRQ